ncbi:MAG: hypothetical protein ACOX7F_07865 [Eubacteriales bacterium]|jgi:hypothetical protein
MSLLWIALAVAICAQRLWVFIACWQPDVQLWERTLLSFTLPNIITAVVVLLLGVLAARASRTDLEVERKLSGTGVALLMGGAFCFLLTGVGYGALRFVIQAQVQVSDLLVSVALLALAFLSTALAPALRRDSRNGAVAGLSMFGCLAILLLLVCSYVGRTEMAVLEQYMYYLLLLCAGALAALALSKAMLRGTSLRSARYYLWLTLYCAAGELLPAGVLEKQQGQGWLPLILYGGMLAAILLMALGIEMSVREEQIFLEEPESIEE